MTKFLLIFLAGGIGSILRYAVSGWAQRSSNSLFPLGTLCVNVIGCFLIGAVAAAIAGRVFMREEFRVALVVGLLGGFTTFSAFGYETFALLNHGQLGRAAMNATGSVVAGLFAVWLGYRMVQSVLGV